MNTSSPLKSLEFFSPILLFFLFFWIILIFFFVIQTYLWETSQEINGSFSYILPLIQSNTWTPSIGSSSFTLSLIIWAKGIKLGDSLISSYDQSEVSDIVVSDIVTISEAGEGLFHWIPMGISLGIEFPPYKCILCTFIQLYRVWEFDSNYISVKVATNLGSWVRPNTLLYSVYLIQRNNSLDLNA